MSEVPQHSPLVLVTGANGLIGSRFLEIYGDRFAVIEGSRRSGFDILQLDSCRGQLRDILGGRRLDAIVHLAAFIDVSAAFRQAGDTEGECYQTNVTGTKNMVALANEFGAHLIHMSTDFVFSGNENHSLSETDAVAPIEWYGETKCLAEQAVSEGAQDWTILRIGFPFQREEGVRPDLVTMIRAKLAANEELHLFGDQVITPTFADDIADAIARFLQDRPNRELFHVVGPDSCSPFELGHRIAEIMGVEAYRINETSLEDYLKKDPRPRQVSLMVDSSKYREYCKSKGHSVPRSVREALA